MITTVEQFIAEIGGTTVAADVFATGMTVVSNWKKRGRFPAWAAVRARDIARTNKMRVDPRLFEIHRPTSPKVAAVHAAE